MADIEDPPSPPASARSAPMIDIQPGSPVPLLISPSANPYSAGRYALSRVFTVGDSATFRISDILTGIEGRTLTARVTRVDYDEDRVEYNRGRVVTDLMGNPIKTGEVEYDTPAQFTPAEFQVGKKWTAAFHRSKDGRESNAAFDMRIAKRETIVVPAGSFDTFRIEGEGWNYTAGARREMKLWLVPGLNFAVRAESITRNKRGRFVQTDRREIIAVRQHVFEFA